MAINSSHIQNCIPDVTLNVVVQAASYHIINMI